MPVPNSRLRKGHNQTVHESEASSECCAVTRTEAQPMTSPTKSKPIREINCQSKSAPAQSRMQLYRFAIPRIESAIRARYPLEAIALLESAIADRLESRVARIHDQASDKRKFSTLGRLISQLCGRCSGEADDAKLIYNKVPVWAARRNKALHEMVKLAETDATEWKGRQKEAQTIAEEGLPLFREVDALVKKLNRSSKHPSTAMRSASPPRENLTAKPIRINPPKKPA